MGHQIIKLSIISNYKLKIIKNFHVSPNCFFPRPKVTSTVYLLYQKNINCVINKIENLEYITNQFFSKKRKMINKSIKKIFKNKEKLN